MVKKEKISKKQFVYEGDAITKLVQLADTFESRIYIECGSMIINAKSLMGMMNLRIDDNTKYVVSAEGDDENEAVDAIIEYIER